MPKAISTDLRERVVRFVEAGHSRHAAAARFGVSVSFAVRLVDGWRKTGSLMAKPSGGRRRSKLDPHRKLLLGWVAGKDDITMPELAAKLAAATGTNAAPASLSRWLIRQGFSVKKNAAGRRTRSARHPPGARALACQASTQDAGERTSLGVCG